MRTKTFFIQLFLVSLFTLPAVYLTHRNPAMREHLPFSLGIVAFFVLFSTGMFYAGRRAVKSQNKNDFTNVSLGFTAGKMFLTLGLLMVYTKVLNPSNNWFVFSFFGLYLIYTLFEMAFMIRLGRSEAPL